MQIRVNHRYILGHIIGSGSYGKVYTSKDAETNEPTAIKLEPKAKHNRLSNEAKLYDALKGGRGIPSVRWYGTEGDFNVMVMDMLGDSLETLRYALPKQKNDQSIPHAFSLKTVLMIGLQLLDRIEYIHDHGILHRDIKPENILIGNGAAAHIIHIVDFGLAKYYRRDDTHISSRTHTGLTGTTRYASINAHKEEQSRRDDMESIGFVLVCLLRGRLPWQGMKTRSKKRKHDQILDKKTNIPLGELCWGCPPEFQTYFEHCRNLGFVDTPDYSHLKQLLRNVFERESFTMDKEFDWILADLK